MIQKAVPAASWLVQQRTTISHAQGVCLITSTVDKVKINTEKGPAVLLTVPSTA